MEPHKTSIDLGGRQLILKTGHLAQQANAAVVAEYGETVVFCSIVMGKVNENLNFFPLHVEYQEKLYAGGRIKGSRWVKRPGRPSDDAILKARLIDRTIRPLFPEGMRNDMQIILTVLSADGENDADIPAMYAVSAALELSDIPFDGPVSAVRLGLDPETNEFIINPTFTEREKSSLDLIFSGTNQAPVMVEAGALEVPESDMLEAFELAQSENQRIATAIQEFGKKHGKDKTAIEPITVDPELLKIVKDKLGQDKIDQMVKAKGTLKPSGKDEYVKAIAEDLEDYSKSNVADAIDKLIKKTARAGTLEKSSRPDGRKPADLRDLSSQVSLLPRTHGSAIFQRGATQALTITTVGSPSLNQLIENMEGEESKRYIHHYNMPPFTVGETGRMGWPKRREVGHGALAERALEPMIPDEADFPYTIHVVTEIMSSNGSTSMASVCGSSLSLMDAGVPLKKPVAGIAMGVLIDGENYKILTDIQGFEDYTGDMDFKVAGTKDGITAMQMDMKVKGISLDILTEALEQAKVARLQILDHMEKTLPEPRKHLSPHAPKIDTFTIPVEDIGEIIGPGGKVIKAIIKETGAEVDVQDDGRIFLTSEDEDAIKQAREWIEGILKEVEAGEVYMGKVVRIVDFGAFVEILPGKDGLVHVSKMADDFVKDPRDIVEVGDEVKVRVIEIDKLGRINLTMMTDAGKDNSSKRESRNGSGNSGNKGNKKGRKRYSKRNN